MITKDSASECSGKASGRVEQVRRCQTCKVWGQGDEEEELLALRESRKGW